MSEHVERNLQRNLRGMTLTNYRTVGDVRAIRKCERVNQQIGRTRHQMDKIYASDLKTANMEVEFRQKVYAGQLMRIETDKQRAISEHDNTNLILKNSSPRQKIVTRNSLKRIIGHVTDPSMNGAEKLKTETEQAEQRKETLKKNAEEEDQKNSKRAVDALARIQRLALPIRERRISKAVQPEPVEKVAPQKVSLPILMAGGEYIITEIPDAPILEEPRDNALFYREMNKYEWVGVGYDYEKQQPVQNTNTKQTKPSEKTE
ncbi:uncharacterized protein LOC142336898 [Convolutriloba macropyga]|uniref:uncharacterized protein LOC142336898 n=1 Tax=Convolutriloba macropyga TaxID=536237 RepID=UPI003F51B1B5